MDAGDDLPEGVAEVVFPPGLELAFVVLEVVDEVLAADEDGAVDEEEVVADVFGFGGDSRDGVDETAEEGAVGAEEDVGVVPDVVAEAGGAASQDAVSVTEKGGDAVDAVDASSERGPGDGSFELVAEGLEVGDVPPVEGADFRVALGTEELRHRGREREAPSWPLGVRDEVILIQKLGHVGLPIGNHEW